MSSTSWYSTLAYILYVQLSDTHVRMHVHACTYTHARTRTHTHARTHTHTHARTHTHTHTLLQQTHYVTWCQESRQCQLLLLHKLYSNVLQYIISHCTMYWYSIVNFDTNVCMHNRLAYHSLILLITSTLPSHGSSFKGWKQIKNVNQLKTVSHQHLQSFQWRRSKICPELSDAFQFPW